MKRRDIVTMQPKSWHLKQKKRAAFVGPPAPLGPPKPSKPVADHDPLALYQPTGHVPGSYHERPRNDD